MQRNRKETAKKLQRRNCKETAKKLQRNLKKLQRNHTKPQRDSKEQASRFPEEMIFEKFI